MKKLAMVLALFVTALQAQQSKPAVGEFTFSKITFVGSQKYSQQDLLKVSGLTPGSKVSAQSLQDAADRLAATGAFTEVRYRSNATSLEFQISEEQELVPCIFDNFVWFEDAHLQSNLRARVPLYTGLIPTRGNLNEKIVAALEQMLAEKHVTATVSALPEAQFNGPITAMVFAVSTPEMKIGKVQFVGVSSSELATMQAGVKGLIGNDFRMTFAAKYLKLNLLPLYRRDGFLSATFQVPTAAIASSEAGQITVDLTAAVAEGQRYKVAEIAWVGSDLLPQKDAVRLILLKPGDIANEELLRKTLSNIGSVYSSKGYLAARIKAKSSFEEERSLVSYDLRVTPGDLYHMGKLDIQNLDEARKEKLRQVWKLKSGDIYDPVYVSGFLNRDKQALSALDGWSAAYKQTINDETKLVDVLLIFQKGGPLR